MSGLLLFAGVFLLAFVGVAAFRKWSLKVGLLDAPNERSSHSTPTPRGGGVVIVILCLVFYSAIAYFYPESFSLGYLFGAVIVAAVSWIDDVYSLSFLWRLAAHAAAAVGLIFSTGLETFGVIGSIIAFFWIVSLINAYNFMDGIDGIAALQAVIAAAGWFAIGYIFQLPAIYYLSSVIAASSLGFLIHNWQPAKVFLGDVGSAFLGFTFAAMPLLSVKQAEKPSDFIVISAILFLWFFIFDSLVTFFKRLFARQNVFSAHREHIYQRLVQSGMSHGQVTTVYGILTFALSVSTVLSVGFFREKVLVTLAAVSLLTSILIFVFFFRRPTATR